MSAKVEYNSQISECKMTTQPFLPFVILQTNKWFGRDARRIHFIKNANMQSFQDSDGNITGNRLQSDKTKTLLWHKKKKIKKKDEYVEKQYSPS